MSDGDCAAEAFLSSLPGFIVALDPRGRVAMTRDMELIRLMLRQMKERTDLKARVIEVGGYEDWVVQRHAEMLFDAGYLDGSKSTQLKGVHVLARDLSWEGHDFADALGNDEVWSEIKKTVAPPQLAALPLKVIGAVGMKLLETLTLRQFGLE